MIRIPAHDRSGMEAVVRTLQRGGVACIPTDTAYGLAVDPGNPGAVERLFEIKGRQAHKPILLLVDSVEMTETVAVPSGDFALTAAKFWPGPITLVIPARPSLSDRITARSGTVGVRWPQAEFPLRLLAACGHPVTATSANRTGGPIAETIDEAIDLLGTDLDAAVDAGTLPRAGTSTVLDLTSDPPEVVREGPVSYRDLAMFLGGRLRRRPA